MTRNDNKVAGHPLGAIQTNIPHKTKYYRGEIDNKIFMMKQKERAKYINWLLEKIPHPKIPNQEKESVTLIPRFMVLSRESLELYKETGEMKI